MAITQEAAKKHAKAPAVLCCRNEAGTQIAPEMLEDPALFADLEETGILTLSEDTLRIHDVLVARLTKTLDALMPLTKEDIDEIQVQEEDSAAKRNGRVRMAANGRRSDCFSYREGKDIEIRIPTGMGTAAAPVQETEMPAPEEEVVRRFCVNGFPCRRSAAVRQQRLKTAC